MAGVTVKQLNKVYAGGTHALFDFDLEVKEGEFLTLFGPSSCGKSTVVRTVAGLEEATSGEIYIGNKLVNDVEPKDRDIAMVFPNSPLYPHLSVAENMGYGLKLRKAPKEVIDLRVKEAAAVLGLSDILTKKPKQLTAVQRQRVALGRVLVREPAVFLLDEPLGGLDDKLRVQMRTEVVKLYLRMKKTFLYATDDRLEAMTMAGRVAVMKDGFLQQVDTPQNLYDYPANLFVADMVGDLNFVRGALLTEDAGKYEITAEGVKVALSENTVNRFERISDYANTGKPLAVAIRPEDGSLEEGTANPDRLQIFDGETERTLLSRDEGYEAVRGCEKATAYLPPTPQEMKERIKNALPKKNDKKGRK